MTPRLLVPLLGLGLALLSPLRADSTPAPQLKLGMQTWTFRRFTLADTFDKVQQLGLHYVQVFPKQDLGAGLPGQFDYRMPPEVRAKVLAMAKAHDITIVSTGVINGRDPAEWRKIFAFAKDMGLTGITVEPKPAEMSLVDGLSKESGISVAIHNHPPPTHYANYATVAAAIAPYGDNWGFCADTGHWVRTGEDPVANLHKAGVRILAVHFKDLNRKGVKAAIDVPWGTGISDAAGQIAELRRQGYAGIVFMEYEHDTPALLDEVTRSVAFFNRENGRQ